MESKIANRIGIFMGVAGIVAFLGAGWLYIESKKHTEGHVEAKAEEHAGEYAGEEKHGDEHGHGHGGESSDLDRPVDELWGSSCEHNIPQYECDECRYEVGVVKVPAEMLESGGGIVKTAKSSRMAFSGELSVSGEVGMNEERTTHVTSPLTGAVKKIYVAMGDRVEAGSPLFDIDSHEVSEAKAAYQKALSSLSTQIAEGAGEYQRALSTLDAEVSDAGADYVKSLAALDLAQKTADRENRLFEKSISAKMEVDEANARLSEAKVEAYNAKARLLRLNVGEEYVSALGKGDQAAKPSLSGTQSALGTSEANVNVRNARARLLKLGLTQAQIDGLAGGKEYKPSDVTALSSKEAQNMSEANIELYNAKVRLQKLGLGDAAIEELSRGGNDLSGIVTVRAPRGGTVLEKLAISGEFVETGKDMLQVTDLGQVWVWANLKESDFLTLRKASDSVLADVEVPGGEKLRGRVDLVSGVMDEATRTIRARVVLQNGDGNLRPGMFVSVSLLMPGKSEAVAVPKASVLYDEGRAFVFTHKEKEYWIRRPVVTGRELGGLVEVLEGLDAGQSILADGSFVAKSDVLRSKMGAGCAD